MTKYLLPEIMNSNLNYLSNIFGIDHKKAHRAIQDAKATAQLFELAKENSSLIQVSNTTFK